MSDELEVVQDLKEKLRAPNQRNRIGLWLASRRFWADAANAAAQLGIDAEDVGKRFLEGLPEKARYSGLSGTKVIRLLDEIADNDGNSPCVLVCNLDLLLAGLQFEEREDVWQSLWQRFPYRRRALLIVMPEKAYDLTPPAHTLNDWLREGRLVGEIVQGSE